MLIFSLHFTNSAENSNDACLFLTIIVINFFGQYKIWQNFLAGSHSLAVTGGEARPTLFPGNAKPGKNKMASHHS